jgi:hypothetical protein
MNKEGAPGKEETVLLNFNQMIKSQKFLYVRFQNLQVKKKFMINTKLVLESNKT